VKGVGNVGVRWEYSGAQSLGELTSAELFSATSKLPRLTNQRLELHMPINSTLRTTNKMLLAKLLLLPVALASSVTVYVSSVPISDKSAIIPSPIPLAQIEYDADQAVGTLASYTPPTGSYSSSHLLRIGLSDPKTGSWRGIVTSAASFEDQYHKKFVIHVDEKGEPYHVGFGTSAKGSSDEVEVEIVKRSPGPRPVLNKPIVLNAEGKLDSKEPEKSFLQKCVTPTPPEHGLISLTISQVLVGHCIVPGRPVSCWWWGWKIAYRKPILCNTSVFTDDDSNHDDSVQTYYYYYCYMRSPAAFW
tara:strand:+ start:4110 stop:5018 length:909 start_codon:yes stop_codon:yes gene_type:complete